MRFSVYYSQLYTPTGTVTISDPKTQKIGEFYVVQDRRTTDIKVSKLGKGRSGL